MCFNDTFCFSVGNFLIWRLYLGGVETLLIGVAIGSSLAMILPISTPPNALAHATGMIQQKDMEKVGIIMGIIGLILGYTILIILGSNKLL